jgi:hypothetical protein
MFEEVDSMLVLIICEAFWIFAYNLFGYLLYIILYGIYLLIRDNNNNGSYREYQRGHIIDLLSIFWRSLMQFRINTVIGVEV